MSEYNSLKNVTTTDIIKRAGEQGLPVLRVSRLTDYMYHVELAEGPNAHYVIAECVLKEDAEMIVRVWNWTRRYLNSFPKN